MANGTDQFPAKTAAVRNTVRPVPSVVAAAGTDAAAHYHAYFAAFANDRVRRVYQAQAEHFFRWAEERKLPLTGIRSRDAALYTEELAASMRPTSVASYRSILVRLFRHLKLASVIAENPFEAAAPESGGKNPVHGREIPGSGATDEH